MEATEPRARMLEFAAETVALTLGVGIFLGLIISPVFIVAAYIGPIAVGQVAVAVLSFAIYTSQSAIWDGAPQTSFEDLDLGVVGQTSLMVMTILCYNAVLFVALFVALAAGPELGYTAAALYTVYDFAAPNNGVPLSISSRSPAKYLRLRIV